MDTAQDSKRAFLSSLEEDIDHGLKTLDLHKIHEMDLSDLEAHFGLIIDEMWEEPKVPAESIDVFKAATREALKDFKRYYQSFRHSPEIDAELKAKIDTRDFKDYLHAFLRENFENRFVALAKKQKLLDDVDYSDPIKLVKLFNKAASELKKKLSEEYDPNKKLSEDDIADTAGRYAKVISGALKVTDTQKTIIGHVIEAKSTAALENLNRRQHLGRGPRTPDEIKEICRNARRDTLASLFDIAERTQMIPKTIRDFDTKTLGFQAPERAL